jgi:hypothetical protein
MEDPTRRALIISKLKEGRAYKATLDGPKIEKDTVAAVRGGYLGSLLAIVKRFVSPVPVFLNITWGGGAE